jgi:transposase
MWTPTTRRQHSRAGLRYGSDLTDAEWEVLAPFLPAEARCGRKRAWPMREIVNAISYILRVKLRPTVTPAQNRRMLLNISANSAVQRGHASRET